MRQWVAYEDHVRSFEACMADIVQLVNRTLLESDKYKVRMFRAGIVPPTIEELGRKRPATTRECMIRKHHFTGTLVSDVSINDSVYTHVTLGKIPLMIGSSYAVQALEDSIEDELGGYFMLHGSEKAILPQERLVSNHVLCLESKYPNKAVEYRAQRTNELKVHAVAVYQKNGTYMAETKAYKAFPLIDFCVQGLGIDPRRAHQDIGGDTWMHEWTLEFDPKHVLPHMTTECEKFCTFVHMVRVLQRFEAGTVRESDRDHYMHKRVDASGTLVAGLFRQIWSRFTRDALTVLAKPDLNRVTPNTLFRPSTITNALKYSISTGNWGVTSMFRSGVSQVLPRLNHAAALAHLRRINAPTGKEGTAISPRMLHGSAYGRICVFETPEGQNTGLHKSLAVGASISAATCEHAPVHVALAMACVSPLTPLDLADETVCVVFVNGIPRACTSDPQRVVDRMRAMRRSCDLAYDVSVTYDRNPDAVWIQTDRGRLVRPLWIGTSEPRSEGRTWGQLLESGCVEYLDAYEERYATVFVPTAHVPEPDPGVEYTHRELDPNTLFGLAVAEIPFANHNQAPRNCYQTSQRRQALAVPSWDHAHRYDTTSHLLWSPQRPLAQTETERALSGGLAYLGVNCIVAFACYGGWNQEDSIVFNRGAVDRGLFRATTYRTHTEELRGDDRFGLPASRKRTHYADYGSLDGDGMPRPGDVLNAHAVVVGKTNKTGDRDLSVGFKHPHGRVQEVVLTTNDEPKPIAHVRTTEMRVPEIGDKFCSRAAQKGVIGMILPQEDMPFTPEGIVPDLMINPHCLPSRMTIAQVLEMITGKAALVRGCGSVDATSFRATGHELVRDAQRHLRAHGYESTGSETLIHGATGLPMEAKVFVGPCYYMRLKHMVSDKCHARARGPIQGLVRQPTEGRSKNSGLRMGDMETAALVAHGTTDLLLERMIQASDAYQMTVCRRCGVHVPVDTCRTCGLSDRVDRIELPYALKLLFQELQAVGIDARMH